MKSLKTLVLAGLTVLVVSAVASATASAAKPEFLGTLPTNFTTAGLGVATLSIPGSGQPNIECTASKGSGQVANAKSGTWKELFEGCHPAGLPTVKCTGLLTGETGGDIKAEGTFTIGFELGTLNPVAVLTVSPEVHFECLTTLVNVKGCFEGKVSPANTATKNYLIEGTATQLEDYTSDTGASVACELLASANSAAFKLAVEQVKVDLTGVNALTLDT